MMSASLVTPSRHIHDVRNDLRCRITDTTELEKKTDACENRSLRTPLQIRYKGKITNQDIRDSGVT